jgi:FKBP-type peptidyl-prolyl cis-trans isomerase (trigger factor)
MTKTTPSIKSYTTVDIKKLPQSQVEITASVSAEALETHRAQALKNINNTITVDGFRKGNVPENILISKVGDMAILEEMSELALSKAYMDIIIDNKIDAIGRPKVSVTKLAKDNPVEFKIVTAVVPDITLPDYKKIAQAEIKKNDPKDLEVTSQDIEDSILRIRKSHASHEGHDHEKMTPEEHDKAIEAGMPELTDDFVKTLGDFSDVPDFKNKLSDLIGENKRDQSREKTRVRIADAIADKTTVEIPDLMIESELERTQAQFAADVERMGVKLEDYLKHAKKTLDEVRAEWKPHAEKKAKLQLILNEIAKKEKIQPSVEEIEEEVNHITEHYKDADRERAAVYAETVLTNEKVFKWLEE